MIMSYNDHFQIVPLCVVATSVCATTQEAFVGKQGVERKNFAEKFYEIPGFITVMKVPVI